jgi:hypothetical protein
VNGDCNVEITGDLLASSSYFERAKCIHVVSVIIF